MKSKCKSSFWGMLFVCFCLIFSNPSNGFAQGLLADWKGNIFAGYNSTSGNTDKGSANLSAEAAKKIDQSNYFFKGNMFYSQTNNRMDGQKWDGLAKYFFDFGQDNRWFNFYQVLVDHDRFADIHYRVTPGAGLGYHVATEEDWAWDVDAGLGYRITRYRVNKASDDESLTALVHTFLKRRILANAFLSEDLTVYPGLTGDSGVTLKSESAFTNPISERLDLQLKYILDYNSEPAAGKTTTDKQFVAGIKYNF